MRTLLPTRTSWVFTVALVLAGGPAPAAAGAPGDEAALANEVNQELNTVYRSQQPDGSLLFPGPHGLFQDYPMLATLTLKIHRERPSAAFISQSVSAAARYYSYLFTHRDRNANLLIETELSYEDGAVLTGIEDPGFNALLSMDMISLAILNLELRRPFEALYWYEGARLLQSRLVDRCYDIDANYFFPFDTNRGVRVHDHYALSMVPLLFSGNVGDNHTRRLINHYALGSAQVMPEPPSAFLQPYEAAVDPLFRPDHLAKAVLVAHILYSAGNVEEAAAVGERVMEKVSWGLQENRSSGRHPTATARFLARMLAEKRYVSLYDPHASLDIFAAIARFKRRLADNEIVRLEQSIRTVTSFSNAINGRGPSTAYDLGAVESSIRNVYWAVSKTREQLHDTALFDRDDAYRSSGLELEPAMRRLLDDVVLAMRRVENDLYRLVNERAGVSVTATLLNERAVVDQAVEVRWAIAARGPESLEITAAEVIRGQEVDSLLRAGEAVVVRPGQSHVFVSRFTARPDQVGALRPWHLTLSFTDGTGQRIRYNAIRTIFLEHAVDVTAMFPQGQILQGLSLPIDIRFIKRTNAQVSLTGGWFSPSGLQLKEGNRFQLSMAPVQDTVVVRMNVLVPSPCRPGSFPFKMKFLGDGKDLGVISSSFFKPYQWLFLGPFEASENAIATPYPPEKSIDLQRGYAGIGKRIAWRVLPESANLGYGEVHMWGSLHPAGVGYMYTVIESSLEKPQCPVYIASSGPATLFLNGERILDFQPGPDRVPAQKEVKIRRGMNNFLIKVVGNRSTRVFFKLGDDDNLASDEFNNNLWELVGNFGEFQERTRRIEAGETEDVQKLVTLRYSDAEAHSVSVIGSFNGWSPEHSRMHRTPGGAWEITLSLRPGKYAYRFLVNNRRQVLDPNCPIEEPDGYGGKNSVIYVTASSE
jgi:hypothetical protein